MALVYLIVTRLRLSLQLALPSFIAAYLPREEEHDAVMPGMRATSKWPPR